MGVNVPGQLLVWYAFAANLVAGYAFFRLARGETSYRNLALKSYHLFTFSALLAAAYLFYLFFSHNYAVKYVFEYSDRSLPFFYKLSAFWAGQEGSYLLWVMLSALFGYVIIRKAGRYTNYAMAVYSSVNLFFLTLLVKLSPFALLEFHAEDGAGLNPLLQDPWMVIHPPVIFVGYALSAVPFAIALAALIRNDYGDWVARVFPWTVATALMLGAGNILGGYWAYKTLGWGGYWAWDPVENSSFIPWFVSLAMLHGLTLERRSGALRKTNILLSALLFILVVYGTFLTRSGVLADFSVHSFVDLGVNVFLIGFMILFVMMTLVLFFPRIKSMGHVALNYNFYGREFFLFAGLVLLFVFAGIVLFWTSLPLLTSWFSSTPRAADLATYNGFALPFAILLAFLLTASPFGGGAPYVPLNWRPKLMRAGVVSGVASFFVFVVPKAQLLFTTVSAIFETLTFTLGAVLTALIEFGALLLAPEAGFLYTALATVVVTGMRMYFLKPDLAMRLAPAVIVFVAVAILCPVFGLSHPLYVLFIAAASMSMVSNVIALARLLPRGWRLAGAQLAHFGFGVMLVGILGSSAFASSKQLVLPRGESSSAYGISVAYQGMENDVMQPKNKLILALDDGGSREQAYPQLYYSRRLDGIMKRPYIKKSLLYDLYYSPQQIQEESEPGGLLLAKGKTKSIGDYTFTFMGFSMDQHGQSESGLRVSARLQVEQGNITDTIEPALQMLTAEDGSSSSIDFPAQFGENENYIVSIERILADKGAVVLSIPGLAEAGKGETLILDVTKKPVINLVWVGTTLILLGSLVAFLRRRAEVHG